MVLLLGIMHKKRLYPIVVFQSMLFIGGRRQHISFQLPQVQLYYWNARSPRTNKGCGAIYVGLSQRFSTRVPPVQCRGSASLHSNPSVYFIIICILLKYNQIPIRSFCFASIRFAFISEVVSTAAAPSAIDFIILLFTDIAAFINEMMFFAYDN